MKVEGSEISKPAMGWRRWTGNGWVCPGVVVLCGILGQQIQKRLKEAGSASLC